MTRNPVFDLLVTRFPVSSASTKHLIVNNYQVIQGCLVEVFPRVYTLDMNTLKPSSIVSESCSCPSQVHLNQEPSWYAPAHVHNQRYEIALEDAPPWEEQGGMKTLKPPQHYPP